MIVRGGETMKRLSILMFVIVVLALVSAQCQQAVPAAPEEAPAGEVAAMPEFHVVVIGKSVHPYWSNVEKGVRAAANALGLQDHQAIFFVPPTEDVAKQIETMETYVAQKVTGIAIAPSDPNALEPVMKKAVEAGIIVTTLDTPPVENSVSLVYIGTDNYTAGMVAGEQMKLLLPEGGKVGIGRGSDTALNALQRTEGFLEVIKDTQIAALEPVNDKEDAARALELANSVISASPDLAGAFGVYAYNGPAWATAIKEANAVDNIKLVCFDATTDIINGIKEGVVDATVAQREFDMGYKSVELIYKLATEGKEKAMVDMGVVEGIIDTGVDVITQANLKAYEAALDDKGIPHEWTTEGWEPEADELAQWGAPMALHPALEDGKITIAWIPKALNNPVFELGRDGALTKGEELTKLGPYEVEVLYVGSVASDMAEQARVMEDMIAKKVDAIGVSCNDPDGCIDPINKAIEAGIEVMTWDADSPESERFTYLGVSNYEGGRAAADLLVRAMGTEGKVALLTGVPGALNLEERIRGFKDEVAEKYPDIEIVTTVACYDDINQGVQVVEETMQVYPDLDGWFFVGLWPLFAERGSMPLWEGAAVSGQLKTVAFDTLPVELEYVKEGLIHGLVGQKYWGWGYDTVQMLYDRIMEGKEFEPWTDSGMDIVTINNVDAMIKAWETGDFLTPLPDPFEASEALAQ
jgi:ribose transport system substrate-binding protein